MPASAAILQSTRNRLLYTHSTIQSFHIVTLVCHRWLNIAVHYIMTVNLMASHQSIRVHNKFTACTLILKNGAEKRVQQCHDMVQNLSILSEVEHQISLRIFIVVHSYILSQKSHCGWTIDTFHPCASLPHQITDHNHIMFATTWQRCFTWAQTSVWPFHFLFPLLSSFLLHIDHF